MAFTGGFSRGFSTGFAIGSGTFAAIGTGGVAVGGSAVVSSSVARSYTGTGGVTLAGSALAGQFRIFAFTPTGGVTVAGTATPVVGRVVAGSGGVVVGGTAGVATDIAQPFLQLGDRDYTGTGVVGDREPGGAVIGDVIERVGASGVVVSREGAMGARKPKKPGGAGGRTVVQHFLARGGGLVVVGGAALVGFVPSGAPLPPVPQEWLGSGGVLVGGAAGVSVNIAQQYAGYAHGGVTVRGVAGASASLQPAPVARSVFGSGGVRAAGSAPTSSTLVQRFGRVGTGGVRVAGSAPVVSTIVKRLVYPGSGLVIIRGSAAVSRVINAPGGGGGAFTTPIAPATFDTTRNPAHFTSEVVVTSMADLQAKLNTVPAGTRLRVPLGVDWSGSITLRNRGFTTNQWIEIAPDLDHAVLEAARPYGRRMNLGIAASLNLPTLRTPGGNGSIVYSDFGAAGYRLTGLNFRTGGSVTAMVRLGNSDMTTASQACKRMIVDRCTAVGGTTFTVNRAIYIAGCEQAAVLGCWLTDIYGSADSQSILVLGWPGPVIIKWNRLEGWSENVMFGGGETAAGGVPSDATIEENLFTKNLSYRFANPFGNSVKNLIEFKSIQRVRARYNVFEFMWKDGQPFPANFKSVDQGRQQPQQGTNDVEFAYCWLRDVSGGFNLSADPEGFATDMRRVYIHDNLIERINLPGSDFAGNGIMLQMNGGLSDVTLDHNTWVKGTSGGVSAIAMEGAAVGPIAARSNIILMDGYPLKRTDSPVGRLSWEAYVPNAANRIWQQNVAVAVAAEYQGVLPAGTILRASDAAVGYTDLAGGDYTVTGALATAGHDGAPVGVRDIPALKAALLGVENG